MIDSITLRFAVTLSCAYFAATALAEPPGRIVDVDGRALHVVQTPGTGPTIVFEAGGGGFSSYWLTVQPKVAALGFPTLSYDRAGLGWSDPDPMPYRIADRADDLDTLLEVLGIKAPIVLVAHSYGGWIAQVFASRHPERIRGMVLVDPNSSHFFERYPDRVARLEQEAAKLPPKGLGRIALKLQRNWLAKHSKAPRSAFDPILLDRHQVALRKMLAAFGTTANSVSQSVLPDRPIILISRGRAQKGFPWGDPTAESVWREGHDRLMEPVINKQHWVAEGSDHAVVLQQPLLVVDAICALVADPLMGLRPAAKKITAPFHPSCSTHHETGSRDRVSP